MSRAVAVTGAAGFIGGHVVDALLRAGHHVVAVDRRPAPPHLAGSPHTDRLTYLRTEITAGADELVDALGAVDAVLHLAACPGVRDRAPDVAERRHRDNVLATGAVLSATPLATALVVASSSSVYGGSRSGRACHEDDVLDPRGGYAASKALAEELCALRRDSGGSVTVVRPFTVAGERQRPDMALATWLAAARAGKPLTLLGSTERTRDVTDVRDVVRALLALTERDPGVTVNIGTGRPRTLAELADAVCTAVGRDVPRVLVAAGDDEVRHTRASVSRLARLTGFAPATDLQALLARQLSATASRGLPDGALLGSA